MAGIPRKCLVGEHSKDVGDQQFLGETDYEDAYSLGQIRDGHMPGGQLIGNVSIANDGARDELGEQGDIEPIVDNIFLRRRSP
jgi:hypothetical protein